MKSFSFDILKNQGFKNYFFNTSWLMAEKIFRIAVYFTVGVYVIRYLGPEDFGLLSYAISFVGLFSVLATLGLDRIVVNHLVIEPADRNRILGTSFIMKNMGALIVTGLVAVGIQFTHSEASTHTFIFIIVAGIFFQSFNVIDLWYQSKVLSKYTALSHFLCMTTVSCLKLLCVFLRMPLIYFVWLTLAESAVLALFFISFYVLQNGSLFLWKFDYALAKSLIKQSWPLILSGIMGSLYMRIDHVMLKEMIDSKAVGEYAAAVKLAEVWYFIPMVVSSSLSPAIIKAKSISDNLYMNRLLSLYSFLTCTAIIIAIPTIVFAKDIVMFLYGPQYTGSATILSIYILTGIFVSFGVAKSTWVILEYQQIYSLVYQVIGTVCNIVLNILFIKEYGGYGAALATLATVVLNSSVIPLFLNEKQRKQTLLFFKSFNPMYIFYTTPVHKT